MVYEDGAAITTETDLELYAVWSDAYTVTLRNGDTDTTVLVPQNSAIGSRIPADPTKKGYTFVSAQIEMVPQNYQKLDKPEDIANMEKMLDIFEDDDDVQNVWHNWEQE